MLSGEAIIHAVRTLVYVPWHAWYAESACGECASSWYT